MRESLRLSRKKMDRISKEMRSAVMSKIRSSNTGFERFVYTGLRRMGVRIVRGDKIVGKPDLISNRNKVVVFLDSCFWHGCPWHCRMPKSRQTYWRAKIASNKHRASEVKMELHSQGWKVVRFWEHNFISNPTKTFEKLVVLLGSRR